MITIDEMKDLKVYRKPFYLPTSDKDKTGSAIFLMTPNLESSKNLMNSPLFINRKNSFQSYYMEKNVNTMIKTDASVEESVIEYYADYLEESSLSANDREEIPDKQFGLPEKRKYPLHDAKHVKLAAKFFNYVDKEDEEELAINIKKAAKKFHVTLNPGEDNRLQKYIKEEFAWNVDNSRVKTPKEFNAIYISYKDNESCVDTDLMDKTLWHAMNNFSQLHDFENRKPAYVYVMGNTGKLYKLGIIDISRRQEEIGFRWIETYKIPNDFVSLKEDYKVIYEPRATVDVYGYTHPKTGIYNACVKVEGIKKPLRGRSELMVFKDNTVFMATKDNPDDTDTYRFPGGSWNEDENPMDAAIRETREEARIEVQDVKFCTTFLEVYDDAANWVKKNIPEEHWWYGYYTCLYIGIYKGKYTGHIDEHDKDPKMIRLGKWYDIDKVYDKLPKHHQHAIDMYKRSRIMTEGVVHEYTENLADRKDRGFDIVNGIVSKLDDSDLNRITNNGKFVDSPYIKLRFVDSVSKNGKRYSGFVDVYVYDDSSTGIVVIALEKEARGTSLSNKLIRLVKREAKRHGITELIWRTDIDNKKSYHLAINNGFKELSKDETQYKLILSLESSILSEGFFSQVIMGFKVHPHQNIDETFRKHKYEGLLNLAKRTKKLEDLKYLRQDANSGVRMFTKIKTRIESCSKHGLNDDTENYYKGIKKDYLDKGITAKDVQLTIDWFNNAYIKYLNERIEEVSVKENYTYIEDEFAFYHVQQNYVDPNKMELKEDEYYSSIDDALNMAKHFGKFHVYMINHEHKIIYLGMVNKYSDKWIWVVKKRIHRDTGIQDMYDDYYISKDYIENAIGGFEYLSFKDAFVKYTDEPGLYYVYTKGDNKLPRYIGTLKKHDMDGNWSWCDNKDQETPPPVVAYRTSIIELNQDDLQFHKVFSYYAMSPSQTTDLVFYNKFDDALLNRNIEIGIQYVYSKDKDGNPVLLGAINVYGSEDWEWDYQERIDLETIEVVNETFSKKNVDAAYLTKHFKNYARRGVRHTNKIKRNVKDASLGDEQVPDIEDKGETKKKEAPSIDNTVIAGEYCINLGNLVVYTEDAKNDPYLRRIFYEERLKQDKEVLAIYEQVKASVPFIKYAYIKLPRYQGKNVFYDVSFYNQLFFKNNNLTAIRGLDLYTDLMERMLDPSMPGYTKKTVFIPVLDWENNDGTKMWMYRNGYNPVSMIYQGLSVNPQRIVKMFKDKQVIFIANKQYFRVNFSEIKDFRSFIPKFRTLIDRLQSGQDVPSEDKDDTPNNKESKQAIVNNIIDKLEKSQGIKISNLTGEKKSTSDEKIQKKIDSEKTITSADDIRKDQERRELLDAIDKAASNSDSTDDALDKLEDERIKQIIIDLAAEEEENININNARASRMAKLQNDMYDIEINGKTVKELLNANTERQELPKTSLTNITTINEEWQDLHYINFDKDYDINEDIMKMIDKLSQVQYPIAVRNIKVVDNSTSEDYVDLYTLELEDFRGKRFTVKFDVPKFLPDGKYLLLRGNKKTIQNQLQNMPIIKTDNDTCQIISNYNKIFIRRFGTVLGKSNPVASRLIKALQKYNGNKIKITLGDCRKICTRYELPIDYIDIGAYVAKIETDTEILYLDQDEIKNTYDVDYTQGIPYGYDKRSKTVLYYSGQGGTPSTFSVVLKSYLCEDSTFRELYEASVPTIRSTYSKCSILSTEIPLVIVCAYSEGLENTLRKANIKYELKDKIDKTIKEKEAFDYIKFNDGYVVYENTYASCLLMNGLKESDTESYSLKDINSKMMYTDFLDNYGGKIKADGLENFYDCMIDPITEEVLEHLKLPTDYISVLLHGNALLADNKFIKHTDISTKRLRRKELIAVKVYKTLFNDAYVSYANQLRHSRTVTQFSLKQSAVIDKFLADSTASDNSIINGINDVETANEVTAKGESGMNSDRAYSLDKRTYDSSMLNVLAMSTGFAGNVGITRQATIDMNIEGKRGYVKSINNNTEKMNTTKSLSITEALNPFGVTSDYPFRTAMNFIQTAKHAMRTEVADPLLVTNGSDEAMPYLVSDAFAFKAKFDGVIKEYSPDNYIIIEYNNGHKEYVNLQKTTEKNSDGGFYVPMQLSAVKGLKEGKKIKANDIIAYDETSFSNSLGESDNIAYNVGTLAKVAVINTDENFEDSAIITEDLCEQVATKVIVKEDRMLPKDTNIFNLVKVGTHVSEGDTLMVFQTPYEEEDMNILLRNLVDDPDEISELGRIPIKSHVTGTVTDIKMYRTVELDELSDSLKKAFNDYEKPIKAIKNKLDKEKISSSMLPATYALPATGKLKHGEGCVLIEIYLEVYDIASIGDKIVFDRANKGIVKRIIPSEDAPYTDFRPNEEISAFAGIASFNARMITSPLKIGSVNKLMIELDRSCKDILGIKYDDSKV